MMAKIVQGRGFAGAIHYVLGKQNCEVMMASGVGVNSIPELIRSFVMQSKLNDIAKPVAHISLNFSTQDKATLTNDKMRAIAVDYMAKMGYSKTQFLMVKHNDRDHPHLHLIINRVDFDGKRISDKNERIRNMKVCKELTQKNGLYVAGGKECVKRERLRGRDKTKYKIYDSLHKNLPRCKTWRELTERLRRDGIETSFKTKGATSQVEGVRFTADDTTFNGSKIDRMFSYSKIDFALNQNQKAEQDIDCKVEQNHSSLGHELLGAIGSIFEDTAPYDDESEEEAFRHNMQRKKPKQRRKIRF